jgi:hypothetical protein
LFGLAICRFAIRVSPLPLWQAMTPPSAMPFRKKTGEGGDPDRNYFRDNALTTLCEAAGSRTGRAATGRTGAPVMGLVDDYHAMIEQIIRDSGMSDRALHTHIGLAIYVSVQLALGTRRSSWVALAAVALAEGANEVMDRIYAGSWRWDDTLGDIGATLFWPVVIVLVGQVRRRRWEAKVRRVRAAQALIGATVG